MLEHVMCSVGVDDKRRWVEDYIRPAVEEGSVEGGEFMEMVGRTLEEDDVGEGKGEESGGGEKEEEIDDDDDDEEEEEEEIDDEEEDDNEEDKEAEVENNDEEEHTL